MTNKTVILGKISGVHGVQGWLKVYSYTRPAENIFQYENWKLMREAKQIMSVSVLAQKSQNKRLLVKLGDVSDRSAAEGLVGLEIGVDQSELPDLENEYYWRDLIGLTVNDTHGVELGEVFDLMETGANDVLLLKDSKGKSLAIPYVPEVVLQVDIKQSIIVADWEPLI